MSAFRYFGFQNRKRVNKTVKSPPKYFEHNDNDQLECGKKEVVRNLSMNTYQVR